MRWQDYQSTMPACEQGDWTVEVRDLTRDDLGAFGGVGLSGFFMGRGISPGTYRIVKRKGATWMSDTPAEIRDHFPVIRMLASADTNGTAAESALLITGLGLGMLVEAAIKHRIGTITVVERDPEVIALVGPHVQRLADEAGVDLTIVNADAYDYRPTHDYTWTWHDIWPSICSDNVPEYLWLVYLYGDKAGVTEGWAISEAMRYGGLVDDVEDCDHCNGDGYVMEECLADVDDEEHEDCTLCDGSMEVEECCEYCDGDGTVEGDDEGFMYLFREAQNGNYVAALAYVERYADEHVHDARENGSMTSV